jgi:3-phosphoglycerate kinase
MAKLSIRDFELSGKSVLMRVDFNVPLNAEGEITDDTRIVAALPSIKHLLDGGAKLTLCSHLGRPKGEPDPKYSLRPAALRLAELLEKEVTFADSCVGTATEAARVALQPGEVILLENTRFQAEEKANDAVFARILAGGADIFVNDAFGAAHRAHASTEGVTHHVSQSAMGFLIERELEFLEGKLASPEKPFVAIMGGAKVSDKIQVIKAMMAKADTFIIGGAMAYTFRKAQGYKIGKSLVENDCLELALEILEDAKTKGIHFHLPADTRITQEFSPDAETKVTAAYENGGEIPDDWEGIDIGDQAITDFVEVVAGAKTVLWNGPMGVFEMDNFAAGTKALTKAVAEADALTIVGGGDSVTAVKKFGNPDDFDFISTGGGASLKLLEGKVLPGVASLTNA